MVMPGHDSGPAAAPQLLALGLGCRRGCAAAPIAALVRKTLTRLAASSAVLYTIEAKQDEAGLWQAAAMLELPLLFLPWAALQQCADQALTQSALVQRHFGLPSLSETAALAGAGASARLVLARQVENGASCAAALGTGRRSCS